MPYRTTPLVTGETYHVFNRSVGRQPIFLSKKDYQRALQVIDFYQYPRPPLRFSHYNRLPADQKKQFLTKLRDSENNQVTILAYCLMPNHFHFLAKEIQDKGITTFIKNFQNSYAKYFNTKFERSGALFQSMFKAVRIETDEQLLHVCRYIHLNPISSYLIKDISQLEHYEWSSLPSYIGKQNSDFCSKELLEHFSSVEQFTAFIFDQSDYQRKLEQIKHLLLE